MQAIAPLLPDQFYHIYNHGVGGRNLFIESENYEYFLHLYDVYISPIAETFAWVLMPNHFHLLVRIKDEIESTDLTGYGNLSGVKTKPKPVHQHFSNLYNAYSKAINKRYGHRGALFQRPFKRKLIDTEEYLKQVILYIHNNPVHHGFCEYAMDYPWSSFLTFTSTKATKLMRNETLEWFGDRNNFIAIHQRSIDFDEMDRWLRI